MQQAHKILLVDDDPEDQSIIQDAFVDLGEANLVHYEENGELALQFLEKCYLADILPVLVILDLNMPKLNGTQTLQAIKKDDRFSKISVIVYSTTLNPLEKEKCLQLGAKDFVIKPLVYTESLSIAKYFKEMCENNG
jgi:CheY-like chemotaxis protein